MARGVESFDYLGLDYLARMHVEGGKEEIITRKWEWKMIDLKTGQDVRKTFQSGKLDVRFDQPTSAST